MISVVAVDSFIKTEDIITDSGYTVEVFEFSSVDEITFGEWANYFQQNYCADSLLNLLVSGTGMTKQEY